MNEKCYIREHSRGFAQLLSYKSRIMCYQRYRKHQQSVHMQEEKARKKSVAFCYTLHGRVEVLRNQKSAQVALSTENSDKSDPQAVYKFPFQKSSELDIGDFTFCC